MLRMERRRVRRRLRLPEVADRSLLTYLRRRRTSIDDSSDLITALTCVSSLVRSGQSLESAIHSTAHLECCPDIAALHSCIAQGASVSEACRTLATRPTKERFGSVGSDRTRDVMTSLHILAIIGGIGGRVAEQIDSLVDTLHERDFLRRERRVHAATASASMRMLTWLPMALGVWMVLDSGPIRTFLLGSAIGWTCVVIGSILNVLGRVWTRRVIATC